MKKNNDMYNSYTKIISEKDANIYSQYNIDACLKKLVVVKRNTPDYELYLNRHIINFGLSYYNDFYKLSKSNMNNNILEGINCPISADKFWVFMSVHSKTTDCAYNKSICSISDNKIINHAIFLSLDYANITNDINKSYTDLNITEDKQKLYTDIVDREHGTVDKLNTYVRNSLLEMIQLKYKKQGFIMSEFLSFIEVRKNAMDTITSSYEKVINDNLDIEYLNIVTNPQITFENFNMFIIIDKLIYVFKLKSLVVITTDVDLSCILSVCMILPFLTMKDHVEYNKLVKFLCCYNHYNIIPIFKVTPYSSFDECRSCFNIFEKKIKVLSDSELLNLFGETDHLPKKKAKKIKKVKVEIKTEIEKVETKIEKVVIEIEKVQIEDQIEIEKVEEQVVIEEQEEEQEEEEIVVVEVEENIPTSTTIIDTFKAPYNISFKNYEWFKDRNYISYLINNLYKSNIKFQVLMRNYNYIRVVADLHTDMSGRLNTLHFNIQLYNSETLQKSSVIHAYIADNEIYSMTELKNLI